jgi:hypothetical protein
MTTASSGATPSLDLVADLFQSVWGALTTLDLRRRSVETGTPSRWEDGPTGMVHISGGWAGTVVLRLTAALGNRAASAVLGLEGEDPPPEDIRDVTGEIANVLGGKLKATLPGPCQLSLPIVVDGHDYHIHLLSSRSLGELCFESSGQALSVSIWRKEEKPSP